jgi:lipopolysaccharide assembly outer membrane protein LptD (OstA)
MRSVGQVLWFGFGFLFLAGVHLFAADEPAGATESSQEPAIFQADVQTLDQQTKTMLFQGNVVITYKGSTLRADHVRYDSATSEAWAHGNVRLNRADQEWVAPSAYYNFNSHALKTDHLEGFFDPVYFRGDHLETVSSNHYSAVRASVTTCDYDQPHFRVQAAHGEIFPGDRVVLFNVIVFVEDVPVFWFPVMVWSLKGDRQPFSLSVGDSSQSGFFLLTTTYWRLNDGMQLAFHLDERTERGVGTGADLQYHIGSAGEGTLKSYYINDAAPETSSNLLTRAEVVPSNRYRVEWQHKQAFTNDVDLTIDLNKQSDPTVIHDFMSAEFYHQTEPESVADITKRGDNYTLSALVRPQFNGFFAEAERLPEVKLAVDRTKLWSTPLFYEGESSAGYYNNVGDDTGDPLFQGHTFRADTFHQLVLPQYYFGWLSIVPRAGGRYTYYEDAPDTAPRTNEVSRFVGDLGTEASFKLSRTYDDVQFKPLGIDGLRHILQPFADYQWVPTPNVATNNLFQFDTIRTTTNAINQAFSVTRWSPLDFPAFNTIDAITGENLLRFGLRQKLQMQRDGKPWDLVEIEGWTDWRIQQNAGEKDFSDFFGTLRLRPTQWIAMDASTRYDMLAGQLEELNTEARILNGDRWSVGIGTRFLKDDSNLAMADIAYRLSRHWTAQMYQRFDFQDGTWEEQDYMLRQETHDWYISYGFRYVNQRTGGRDMAAFISLTLKAYPSVQLSANRIDLGSGTSTGD